MLEWAMRFNVKYGQAGALRDWLKSNDAALRAHTVPGWSYLGAWFTVRGFGRFDCEVRYSVDGYASLGSGFGDDESQRLLKELYGDFIDWSTRPEATLARSAAEVQIPASM